MLTNGSCKLLIGKSCAGTLNLHRNAFSLIELMVVIAIVAILAALAVPAYKAYRLRSAILEPITRLNIVLNEIKQTYDKTGAYPTTVKMNGTTLSSITRLFYYVGWGNISAGIYLWEGNGVTLSGTISGLTGIPGYAEPSPGNPSNTVGSLITLGLYNDNGVFKVVCGIMGPMYNSTHIAPAYLPSSCKCPNVQAYLTTGTGC